MYFLQHFDMYRLSTFKHTPSEVSALIRCKGTILLGFLLEPPFNDSVSVCMSSPMGQFAVSNKITKSYIKFCHLTYYIYSLSN